MHKNEREEAIEIGVVLKFTILEQCLKHRKDDETRQSESLFGVF
jgi:hypothetical protein